ncbi:MAG: type I-C CRISPR-associated protein Cas5, partial [Dehalococcoidia bacterium]|nr:type I-C CRISPR-associated protein Cas5 [Dehalococcoidia bacterium]
RRGQCFSQPYLGCREFSAYFGPVEPNDRPIDLTETLGPMLWDLSYPTDRSSPARPTFFEARLERGVLRVPANVASRED